MTPTHPYQALSITGIDAAKTLQGQMTCDVQNVAIGATVPGLLCDIRGRVQIIAWVHKLSQTELWLVTHSSCIEHTQARLRPYLAFSKSKASVLSLGHFVAVRKIDADRSTHRIDLGFAALVDASSVDATACLDTDGLVSAQLEAGIPELGDATRAQYTPQALSLDQHGFISFTKGCYMGQEIIARLHYKGQAKQTLVLLALPDGEHVEDGQLIHDPDGVKIGQIISTSQSGATVCLACINKSALATSSVLEQRDWVILKCFSPLRNQSH